MGKLSFRNFFDLFLFPWDPGREKLWSELVILKQIKKNTGPNIQCRFSGSYFLFIFSSPPKLIILILFQTGTDCSRLMVGKFDKAKITNTNFAGINIMSRVVKISPHTQEQCPIGRHTTYHFNFYEYISEMQIDFIKLCIPNTFYVINISIFLTPRL